MGISDLIGRAFRRGSRDNADDASRFAVSEFGAPPSGLNTSQFAASSSTSRTSPEDARERRAVRRDLLRVVMRDVLMSLGLPTAWLALEVLTATSSGKATGLHGRIVLKHWAPRVLEHAGAIERVFIQRLLALDPMADQWFTGLSWRLDLPQDQQFAPLPASWLIPPAAPARPREARPRPPARQEAGGDVIAGPVRIDGPPAAGDAPGDRTPLDRLLDTPFDDAAGARGPFAPTTPASL